MALQGQVRLLRGFSIYRLPSNNIELLRVPPGAVFYCAFPPGLAAIHRAHVPLPPGSGYNFILHQGILEGHRARRDVFFVSLNWRTQCRGPPLQKFDFDSNF